MSVILPPPRELASLDVTTALGYVPLSAISSLMVTTALGYTPLNATGIFDVRTFGAKGDGSTNDTAAITAAAAAAVNYFATKHRQATIYASSGVYATDGIPLFTLPVSIRGDGHLKTIFLINKTYSGDVFSWTDAWYSSNGSSTTLNWVNLKAGPILEGFTILGDLTGSNVQNGLVFYDRTDELYINDVEIEYMSGRAFWAGGALKNAPNSYIRESHFTNVHFGFNGSAGYPTFEINSLGTGDRSNSIYMAGVDIYAPGDVGMVFRGNRTGTAANNIHINGLRIEGLEGGTGGNLLQIGDDTMTGVVNNIEFSETYLVDPYTGKSAFYFSSPTALTQPYQIYFHGAIGGGLPNGKGINIQSGRSLQFDVRAMNTTDTELTVASNTKVGGPIWINAYGNASTWSADIDSSSAVNVIAPTTHQFP